MKLPMKLLQAKWLVFIGGAILLGLAVFQFLSVPPKRRQMATYEGNLLGVRQKSEKLSEILSEIKTVESNLEVVRQALPVEDDIPSLLTQLEQVAKQSGVGVQHLGFGEGKSVSKGEEEEGEEGGPASSAGKVKKISLTAVVDGSYSALQTFFRNLENTSRVVNVTNFRFSPAQKKEEGLPAGRQGQALSVTLGLEAFYLASAEAVAPEAPLTLDTTSKEYIELIRKVKALRVYKSEVSE